ncbi:nicotinate-nucleotide adenylyltransferase [Clostridium sp. D2Q-11]|uniref:Probable nicotinate-nucleotide adenylyltransferase n=1 Tax=Anaeromonas frigoriresistens TaxID=2683708 RepID=A0A942Z7R0_9FIRM|nr:nicotinate-nucleotide adenylyltransferase [Anaeromonas frigoriresistens]MBS4537159.1 nicotinate-nucleotide adenylyltransferase [Anaeromonas frigoriresistens]
MKKLIKIGLMGGTFNPIHIGHLVMAEEIRKGFGLDKVLFIPTGNPPHKLIEGQVSSEDRYIMTLLATASNEHFEVSDIETKRIGTSYTVDTIKELKEIYPMAEFYFITGADAILEIETWKNTKELLDSCKFIAATRPGYNMNELKSGIQKLEKKYNRQISSLSIAPIDLSSTDIRKRLKVGKTVKYMIPDSVINYINKKNLYR